MSTMKQPTNSSATIKEENRMKKEYETPKLEIIEIEAEDIICDSTEEMPA